MGVELNLTSDTGRDIAKAERRLSARERGGPEPAHKRDGASVQKQHALLSARPLGSPIYIHSWWSRTHLPRPGAR